MTAMSSATPRFSYIKMLIVFALLVTVASAVSTEVVRSSPAFNTSTLTSNSTSAKPYLRPDAVMTTSDDASSLSERSFTPGFAAIQQFGTRLKLTLVKYFRKLLWQLDKTFMEKAFITLKLNQPKDGLLESPAFLIWANSLRYYEDPPVKNIFSILTRHYDDQDLAKLLVAVKNVDSTKPLVTRLALKWARKGKTSTEIFKILELDKSGDQFLNNPLVSVWSRYVTLRESNDPTAVMLKTVTETMDDKSLILRAVARARDQDNELVIRLRDAEFERLLAEHETLEGVEKELFKLTRHYDDEDLAKFLVGVKNVDSTKPLVTRLVLEWAHKRKTSTEIFKILELDKSGENFLNNPLVSVWSRYVTLRESNDPTAVMIKTVTETMDDKSSILRAVIQARDQDSELLTRLRDAAFERLLAEHETLEGVEKELSKFTDEVGKKALYRFQKFYGKLKVTEKTQAPPRIARKNNGIHIN